MNYLQTYQLAHGLTPDGIIGKDTAAVMMKDLGIGSIIEYCHFIAQIQHESGNFIAGRENLNYGEDGLLATFPHYFSSHDAHLYARQPEKIANRVYANRMGNQSEVSGDGWEYRGTGALQLTGKANLQAYLSSVGLPLDTDPNVLLQPEHYFRTAKFYFDTNQVWQYCTSDDSLCILKVSKKINLGNADSIRKPIGYDERVIATNNLFSTLV